jgi:stage III sporulation protein SpoIIIAA
MDEQKKIVFKWDITQHGGVKERDGTIKEMEILFATLPVELSQHIQTLFPPDKLIQLNEIYLQLGQYPECIFTEEDGRTCRHQILDRHCTKSEIDIFAQFFQDEDNHTNDKTNGRTKSTTKRKGISGTLHRISRITDPSRNPEKVLGVTVRVGRAMQGLLQTMASGSTFLEPLTSQRQSLLLIGKPGVGKSTALREIAFILSQDPYLTVVVVDKSKELAGDGETPHPAIGKSRWMPVGRRNLQHEIMLEAVENQSPDVLIVDEISNEDEVKAARTIAQRGVMLIATVHGQTVPELVNDRERGPLMGGITSVTLSGREADKRPDKRKQVIKRLREPVFHAALELHSRTSWIFHKNLMEAVDGYLENEPTPALLLEPGQAVEVSSVPCDGKFDYCTKCPLSGGGGSFGASAGRCPAHSIAHHGGDQNDPRNGTQNNPFGQNGGKGRNFNRKKKGGGKKADSGYPTFVVEPLP